jgi:hypothetical protein
MKRTQKWIAGGITFVLSAALCTSSFAAKAMNDEEMDQATAKGQSAVSKGSGNQTIKDKSEASLKFNNTVIVDQTIHNLGDYQKVSGGVVYEEGTGAPQFDPNCPDCVRPTGPQTQALNNKQVTEKDESVGNVNAVQANVVAGNLINAAGENNVAATVNAASSGGGSEDTIKQINDIDQSKAAYVDQSQLDTKEFKLSESESISKLEDKLVQKNTTYNKTETEAKDETFSLDKSKTETWNEEFPVATITININSDSTATGNGSALSTSDSTTTSTSTADSTASNSKSKTYTDTDTTTKTITIDKNIEVNKNVGDYPPAPEVAGFSGGNEGGSSRSRGGDGGVDVSVDKDEDITVTKNTDIQVDAKGVAAVADADANSHGQAYASSAAEGQAKAESDADASLHLPTAEDGSYSSTFALDKTYSKDESETKAETDNSSYDESESFTKTESKSIKHSEDNSQLEVIQADHVKLGDGDQNICLETEYEIEMEGNAQNATRALNIINVVGRNNIATAWNLASSAGGSIDVGPFISGGNASTPGSIHQINTVKQVN